MDPTRRNAQLYPFYVVCLNGFFWFPVFFLYLSDRVGISGAILLESIYYAAVVLFEVPSGWVSDRFGRRLALRLAMLLLASAYVAFFFGTSMTGLAVAQVLLAAGYAFNSGTDTAFHYDSLAACGLEDEYGDREERIARISFFTIGVSALIGGAVGAIELRYAYGLALLTSIAGFGITMTFARPETSDAKPAERLDRQIIDCIGDLRDPLLAWLFGFAVLLTVLIHVPYQLYQPYLDLLDLDLGALQVPTPTMTGAHAFLAMLAASAASSRSVRLARRFGLRATILVGLGFLVFLIAATGVMLHPVIAVLLVFRSVGRGLTAAPVRAAVTPRIPRKRRASYLSMQSLAGRLSFSLLLLAMAQFVSTDAPTWPDIQVMAFIATGLGVTAFIALAVTSGVVTGEDVLESPPADD